MFSKEPKRTKPKTDENYSSTDTDIGVLRKAVIPLLFWFTAGKFMMSMTQYNAKITSIMVKWSEI